jgi:transposase
VIEGAASYGALLACAVGYHVAEAARMDARARRGVGKSDPLDARRIAAAVLPVEAQQLRQPRLNEGVRAALRVLGCVRESMTTDRTRAVNALTALLRVNDFGLDARKSLTGTQIIEVSRWRAREEPPALSVARSEAVRLAKRIRELGADIKTNSSQITQLVESSEAAPLLQETGFGPSQPPFVSPRGPTKGGYVPRPPSPPWPGSTRSRPLPATPSDTDSTAAAIEP